MPQPVIYTVSKDIFQKDCADLAERINKNPVHEQFIPTHLIAINKDGLKVALELRKTLTYRNLKIEQIEIDPDTFEIKKPLENQQITKALLILAIQNTGQLLTKTIQYLDALFEKSAEDLHLVIVVLYDRLDVHSPFYIHPTYFGIGFVNHNYIELKFD